MIFQNTLFVATIDGFYCNEAMYFQQVAPLLAKLPLFDSGHLFDGADTPQQVQRQLADWIRTGKVVQLRGLYTITKPFQTLQPPSYVLANHLVGGSYVSLHTALSHYDLIPEHIAVVPWQ